MCTLLKQEKNKTTMPFKQRRNSQKIWAVLAWAFVLLWAALIFSFSAQVATASAELSGGLLQKLLSVLPFQISEFFLRKMAHFTEFMILCMLIYHALYASLWRAKPFWAFFMTVLYAITDEIHQLFVPGRACQLRDMLIDAAGALLGMLLALGIHFLIRFCEQKQQK